MDVLECRWLRCGGGNCRRAIEVSLQIECERKLVAVQELKVSNGSRRVGCQADCVGAVMEFMVGQQLGANGNKLQT